jgi:hypothetical protein
MPQLDQFTYFTQFFWSCLFAGKEKRAVYALVAAVSLALGFLWMDELQQAVAQFYPSTSGGLSGLPPGPSGDSSVFPILETHESQGPPGPSEGERKIKEILSDQSLEKTYRNYLVFQERIIIKVTEILTQSQRTIDAQDIRAGVDIFLSDTENQSSIESRNKQIKRIYDNINTRGEASYYCKKILEAIYK